MNGEQEILGEYANQGFSLEQSADDILELWFKDTMVAVFSQLGATKRRIREACKRFLERIKEA